MPRHDPTPTASKTARPCSVTLFEPAVAEISAAAASSDRRETPALRPAFRDDRAIDGEHVEPAVVVEVEPRRAPPRVRQAERAKARRGARRRESARVPSLTYRLRSLAGQLRHDEIFVAVVVEVAGIDAHAGFGLAVGRDRHAG